MADHKRRGVGKRMIAKEADIWSTMRNWALWEGEVQGGSGRLKWEPMRGWEFFARGNSSSCRFAAPEVTQIGRAKQPWTNSLPTDNPIAITFHALVHTTQIVSSNRRSKTNHRQWNRNQNKTTMPQLDFEKQRKWIPQSKETKIKLKKKQKLWTVRSKRTRMRETMGWRLRERRRRRKKNKGKNY